MVVSIQYLRAIAATMVVAFHTADHANAHVTLPKIYLAGAAGVDIFFVISGFIMWQTTVAKEMTPTEFLRRRLTRIAPFYWLITLMMCATPFVSGTLAGGITPDLMHTLASLAFIPWHSMRDGPGVFLPVYIPGWSLNFEMMFYVIFAASLWVKDDRYRLVIAVAVFCALVFIGTAAPPGSVAAWQTSPVLLEFAAGLCVGAWAAGKRCLAAPLAGLALAMGIAGLAVSGAATVANRALYWGVPAILIVLGVVELERRRLIPRSPAMIFAGEASYALYLTQFLSTGVVAIAWHRLHLWSLPMGPAIFFAFALSASYVFANFAHRKIELPLLRLTRTAWDGAAAHVSGSHALDRGPPTKKSYGPNYDAGRGPIR